MTKAQAGMASDIRLSTLPITPAGAGVFGLWGGGGGGDPLKIRVRRGAAVVNEGARPAVKVNLLLGAEVAGKRGWTLPSDQRTRIYQALGLKPGDEIEAVYSDDGRRDAGPLTVALASGNAADVMQDWASKLRADPAYQPSEPFLCPIATPYVALTKNGMVAPRLNDALVGGPMHRDQRLRRDATYPVQRRLAMGTLFAKKNDLKYKKDLDDITTTVCAADSAPTTTLPFEAAFVRGLSCHLWLDARNSKPCPGVGILGQMYAIAKR